MSWEEYAGLARQLDAVRATEEARTSGIRTGVAEMTRHADVLEDRLREQQPKLQGLATGLRYKLPALTPLPPAAETPVEPATALRDIAELVDGTDTTALEADRRGRLPALWPRMSSGARNLLVYAIAALVVLGIQLLLFARSLGAQEVPADATAEEQTAAALDTGPDPTFVLLFIVVPLAVFLVASTVLSVAGRPRIANGRVELSRRAGFLMCFLVGPVAIAALLLQHLVG